jgi:glutamate---cysteine ligase / carboxylate-amine ligase
VIWAQWPTAGPTETFGDLSAYRRLIADLIGSRTILDEGMIYYDARLSRRYPTIEIRVADVCTDLEDALVIAALTRALVDTVAADAAAGIPPPVVRSELLRVSAWGAARYGLDGELFDAQGNRSRPAADRLDQLLDYVRPALGRAGDLNRVEHGVARLLREGTGATRQREVFQRHHHLRAVASDVVRRSHP